MQAVVLFAPQCFTHYPTAAVALQDLDKLQSVFAAKPWRQGCIPLLRFMFSTRATGLEANRTGSTTPEMHEAQRDFC
jgi:hypothetical protein